MSIEGNREATDARRGKGIYDRLIANMDAFQKKGLIFGASVTVTTENLKEVSSDSFIQSLSDRGCKAVISRRRGAVPLLGVFRRQYPGHRLKGSPALPPVYRPAIRRPAGRRP